MAGDFTIQSLRGGLNETDPPSALADDQVVEAENVEFHLSMCGEKRRGTSNITLGTVSASLTTVPFMFRHLPATALSGAELWVLYTPTDGSQAFDLQRKTTAWSSITPFDNIDVTSGRLYRVNAASLHGKMFIAFRSTNAADRLHVWDGTSLRRVGLIAPSAAPSAANTGAATFNGKRYYRVRYTIQSGGVTILRSEPSSVLTFTPSGTGSAARVTKPAATSPSEGETHWELEASINNADFYRIATTVVGTTTFDDSTAFNTGYGANTLSEDIGDYTLPWSTKFVVSDDDRLVVAGAWETSAYASRFGWTAVQNETGVGNDERIPIDTTNTRDLDGLDGGELTEFSRAVNGYMFAFKWERIYKIARTGVRTSAYDTICLTKTMGAIPNSLVEGVDENGAPCLYFLDLHVGPCRIGASGIRRCGYDIFKRTWKSVNINALNQCHGVYYPDKQQVMWWLAMDSSDTPTKVIVLQTNEQRQGEYGLRRGWSVWSTGRSTTAYSSVMYSDNTNDNVARSLRLVPMVGLAELAGDRNLIQRLDTGSLDSGLEYEATVKTKPYILNTILNQMGSMAGAVLATAAASVLLGVRIIANFGIFDQTAEDIDLTPVGSEDQVIRTLDDLTIAEMTAAQIEFGDVNDISGLWEVNQIAFKQNDGQTS